MGSRSGLGLGLGSIVLLAPRMQLPRNFPRPPIQPSTRNQCASAPYILYHEGPLRPLCVHLSPSFSVDPHLLATRQSNPPRASAPSSSSASPLSAPSSRSSRPAGCMQQVGHCSISASLCGLSRGCSPRGRSRACPPSEHGSIVSRRAEPAYSLGPVVSRALLGC